MAKVKDARTGSGRILKNNSPAKSMSGSAKAIIFIVLSTFFTAFGQFMLKKGLNDLSFGLNEIISNIPLIIGVSSYAVVALFTLLAFREDTPISSIYPFFSLSFIWVSLTSVIFLKEMLVLPQMIGILLIIAGVCCVGRGATQ